MYNGNNQMTLASLKQVEDGQKILDTLNEVMELFNKQDPSLYRLKTERIGERELTLPLQEKINNIANFDDSEIWSKINDLYINKASKVDLTDYRAKNIKINLVDLSPALRKRLGLNDCDDENGGCGPQPPVDIDLIVEEVLIQVREEIVDLVEQSMNLYRRKDIAIAKTDLDINLTNTINGIGDIKKLDPKLVKASGSSDLVSIVNYLYSIRCKCDDNNTINNINLGSVTTPVIKEIDLGSVTTPVKDIYDLNTGLTDDNDLINIIK